MSADDPVIVIGSGPCGAAAAARLVERDVEVVMLDAGTHAPRGLVVKAGGNTLFRRVSNSEMSEDRHEHAADVDWYSSLSLGGLSNYWTAAVPRFAPDDFTDGGRLDERYEWPVTYGELEPYYDTVEGLLDVTSGPAPIPGVPPNRARYRHDAPRGWRQLIGAANEAGHGLGMMPMAKGRPWMIARRGTEFNSFHCVVRPLQSSSTFQLRTGARVTRLNWSSADGRVESVEFVDETTGQVGTMRGRAVVVAAGAIDSTVLLLRSTSDDFPHGLGNTHGLVGRYLHDHPRDWWTAIPNEPLPALSHPIYVARRPHDSSEPMMATSLTIGLTRPADRVKTIYRGRTSSFGVQVFGTMIPTPEATVSLAPAPDARGDVRPAISLKYDDATLKNLADARDRLVDVFRDAGLAITVPGPFDDVRPGSSVHYGGTARMHRSPEFGVVDASNRLHEVPNVVVCDASCFTTGPEKNPTLTAMAIATRAADHLADELGAGGP